MSASYIRKDQVEAVQLDGEWILLNTEEFTVTKLNAMGGYCWDLLHEASTLPALIQAVKDNYECGESPVHEELEAFLSDMVRCGLVRHAG